MIVSWLNLTALHCVARSRLLSRIFSPPFWNKYCAGFFNLDQRRQNCARRRILARYFNKSLPPQSNLNGPCISEAEAGGRGLPLPLRELLRFWSQKDLAFCIPGIPTSVPPRLLIIAACSLHNHFTARGDRGNPSAFHGQWDLFDSGWIFYLFFFLKKKKVRRNPGNTNKVGTNEVDNRDCLWWERELVRRSSVFFFKAQKKTRQTKRFCVIRPKLFTAQCVLG